MRSSSQSKKIQVMLSGCNLVPAQCTPVAVPSLHSLRGSVQNKSKTDRAPPRQYTDHSRFSFHVASKHRREGCKHHKDALLKSHTATRRSLDVRVVLLRPSLGSRITPVLRVSSSHMYSIVPLAVGDSSALVRLQLNLSHYGHSRMHATHSVRLALLFTRSSKGTHTPVRHLALQYYR